jgi:hypothetical protein
VGIRSQVRKEEKVGLNQPLIYVFPFPPLQLSGKKKNLFLGRAGRMYE